MQDYFVEGGSGEQVTLTNMENSSDYYDSMSGNGFSKTSKTGGVALFTTNASSETSPYVNDNNALTASTLLIGFKFRFNKVDPNLGTPENFRIIAGSSNNKDFTATFGVWHEYSEVLTISDSELKRLRISARNFATAPTSGQLTLEVKEMYIYDVSSVSAEMRTLIQNQQSANYQDGTVTYGESGGTVYHPDTTLAISGKSADSKTVGDAIAEVQINVKKYGVKGDGTTDDTDAINDLFAAKTGSFYFPSGTYKISGTITLPEDSEIVGDGDTSIINMYSCDDLTECTFRGGDKIYPYILVDGDNTKLHDFKLTGNNTTLEKRHAGILVIDADNCFIDNVSVYNINYYAAQTEPTVSGYGIAILRSSNAYIDHCYVEQCGYECIGIVDGSHHCVVSNCVAKNGWRTCMQIHRGAYNVSFIGNELIQSSNAWDALFTLHGVSSSHVANLRLEDNTFKASVSPRTRTEDYAAVVQLMSYCDGLWFINNRIESSDRGLYSDSSNTCLTMVGNLVECNDTSDYRVKIGTANPIIIGNVVKNVTSGQVVIPATAISFGNINIGDSIINGSGVSF